MSASRKILVPEMMRGSYYRSQFHHLSFFDSHNTINGVISSEKINQSHQEKMLKNQEQYYAEQKVLSKHLQALGNILNARCLDISYIKQ